MINISIGDYVRIRLYYKDSLYYKDEQPIIGIVIAILPDYITVKNSGGYKTFRLFRLVSEPERVSDEEAMLWQLENA
jgi:hypothetical protein